MPLESIERDVYREQHARATVAIMATIDCFHEGCYCQLSDFQHKWIKVQVNIPTPSQKDAEAEPLRRFGDDAFALGLKVPLSAYICFKHIRRRRIFFC